MSGDPFGDLDTTTGSGEIDSGSESELEPADKDTGTDDTIKSDGESAMKSVSVEPVNPRECLAFEFDKTVRKVLYVPEAVADEFDNIITYNVGRELTRDHGLEGVTKSELHSAALAVVIEHPEEVVGRVLE